MRRMMLAIIVVFALLGVGGRGAAVAVAQDDGSGGGFGGNPAGEPVTIYNLDGDEVAEVTVTEIVDPFGDFDEFSGPAEGEHYILVNFTIENTGERPYEFVYSNFYGLDALGRAYSYTFVTRTEDSIAEYPELESTDMNAGETVSGVVIYRIPDDVDLIQIYYSFYDDVPQLYFLADLSGGADPADDDDADDDSTPIVDDDADDDADETPEADADDEADETPEANDAGDVSAADCEWAAETSERLEALAPAGEELQSMGDDADPERLREIAADLSDVAGEQRESDPPAIGEEAGELIADALDIYADALETVADAIDEGEEPDTAALLDDIGEANEMIEDAGEIVPLFAECDL